MSYKVGYGSFGPVWLYQVPNNRIFDTPGNFSVSFDFPQGVVGALAWPGGGQFFAELSVQLLAYPGNDGVAPKYVASGTVDKAAQLSIDQSILQADLLSGPTLDFGMRRTGTLSEQVPGVRFQNYWHWPPPRSF